MRVSVCMATHDGAPYVDEQLASVLSQLAPDDEVVVVDDASTDDTVAVVESFRDGRVRILRQESNAGAPSSFERSLAASANELILLCDQDDVWESEKVAVLRRLFEEDPSVDLVVHDAVVFRGDEVVHPSYFQARRSGRGVVKNLRLSGYIGHCMSFRRSLLDLVLPIPRARGVSHDWWIGVLADLCGRNVVFLPRPLARHRRHETNASAMAPRALWRILSDRCVLVSCLAFRWVSLAGRSRTQ